MNDMSDGTGGTGGPGRKKGRGKFFPKGRLLRPAELAATREILGEGPYQRPMLIEYLHKIQDRIGHLPAAHLQGLAELMRIPMAEVYEVASFYEHFEIVADGETPPPAVTVRVCDSISCMLAGADKLVAAMETGAGAAYRVVRAPCMGSCDKAPAAKVGHRHVESASEARLRELVAAKATAPEIAGYRTFADYVAGGGYAMLGACLSGERARDAVIASLSDASLRGMGGAGFPTGRKWSLVRAEPGPRMMAVNGDEGEPGTFKDRFYLERDPHRFLEGMLIAAWAVEAQDVFIYIRDEYLGVIRALECELDAVRAAGLTEHTRVWIRRGAGAYICGEESAMIESIEGKRGLPRHRPPYVAQRGIFQRPTLVNNVETLFWIREILENGPESFAAHGKNGGKGLRSFSVSGRVQRPGVIVAPAGSTAADLIELAGGMLDGHTLKGFLPGGASGGILPASVADAPLDFGKLEQYGSFVGSHAVVILSDHDDMKQVALNLMRFFEDESCGQCTPCRNGTEKAVQLLSAGEWDGDLLADLSQVMADASICGLGQAAPNPIRSVLRFFPEDLAPGAKS